MKAPGPSKQKRQYQRKNKLGFHRLSYIDFAQ